MGIRVDENLSGLLLGVVIRISDPCHREREVDLGLRRSLLHLSVVLFLSKVV